MTGALTADSPHASATRASPNLEPRRDGVRPSILLLHYTGVASAAAAIDLLCDPASKVSCHYVIDEAGAITQLVLERDRAWHAGVSCWAGERDINSHSIGFEIQNPGHDRGYPPFPKRQMDAVARLGRDICARHAIAPPRVLAHSDVAPARKIDPGEAFDWRWLADRGVGHWFVPDPVDPGVPGLGCGSQGPHVARAQRMLGAIGYEIAFDGYLDAPTATVLTAYQRHFRPGRVDGRLDPSTLATLDRHMRTLGYTS